MTDKTLTAEDLPMTFQAKYLGNYSNHIPINKFL